MDREKLRKDYLSSAERFRLVVAAEERALLILSVLRFICFAGGLVLIVLAFIRNQALGILAALVITLIFLYLLKLFGIHSEKKEFNSNLSLINMNEAESLSGNNSMFPSGGKYSDNSHDFSYDVDLFGESSLFQYLNRTVTGYGSDILASWLSDPYPVSGDLAARQEIIRELASKLSWRQNFMAAGMKVPLGKSDISLLIKWLNDEPEKAVSPSRRFLIYLLPSLAILSLALVIAGIVPYSVFILIFLVNLFYIGSGVKATNRIHNILSGNYIYLSSMNSLLDLIGKEKFASATLNEMKDQISGSEISASAAVKKLGRLIQSFDSRLNVFAGFFLNGMLLWDYQCIHRLSEWKAKYRDMFPQWLDILGRTDAFSSLGNYAFNNDGFAYPVRSDSGMILSAGNLGHPLIDGGKRVSNDFTLERQGSICIITGANMAGKSTFLRTVAVNYIIGMTGAPVCASSMVFTPVKLFTSMRTTDSLSGNESYFYAELKRLRNLKSRIEAGEPVFFILDEILKGTNSADKAMGSKMFIRRMIMMKGTGMIATHDISLGDLENEFPGIVFNMCFEIEIDGETISFDYRLYPGITRKMNAALLMKQMGILD
jgi:ABC-type multidrug transport system fused ATPase/permease subunit